MAWQPTTRLQISGHRFLRRRLEWALLGRDPRTVNESLRTPVHSLAAGLVMGVALLAGCLVLALLRPQPDAGTAPIVMERQSGALYVRLGDTLHPVLNLASARLILETNADPQPIAASAFRHIRLGPLLGIPGAPQFLGAALDARQSSWTVCDGRNGTTVVVGGQRQSDVLTRDQTLLVTTSSGRSTYLLFDGRRAVLDPNDASAARALGLDGLRPVLVSPVLLNLIPEAPPIAAPRIPDSGGRGPETLPGFTVGSILRVARSEGDEYYVVLRQGIQRVGRLAAELVRYANSQGTRTTISVAPDVIRATKSVTSLPVAGLPDRTRSLPIADGATLCATWEPTPGSATVSFSVGAQPFPVGQQPVRLVRADGPGPAVDAVYLPPGRMAYVRATSLSGANVRAGTRYLVSDTGARFAVHDDAAAHDLGLPDTSVAAPWSVLAALPAGPELSRANASVAQDVPSPQPGANHTPGQHRH